MLRCSPRFEKYPLSPSIEETYPLAEAACRAGFAHVIDYSCIRCSLCHRHPVLKGGQAYESDDCKGLHRFCECCTRYMASVFDSFNDSSQFVCYGHDLNCNRDIIPVDKIRRARNMGFCLDVYRFFTTQLPARLRLPDDVFSIITDMAFGPLLHPKFQCLLKARHKALALGAKFTEALKLRNYWSDRRRTQVHTAIKEGIEELEKIMSHPCDIVGLAWASGIPASIYAESEEISMLRVMKLLANISGARRRMLEIMAKFPSSLSGSRM